jgi:small subunit ribosomal protein S16
MLIIRLQRTGKKNQADFRIVLAEKEAPVNKKIIEVLGSYNPRKKTFQVKEERLKYWLGQKVSLSETAHNLLVTKGLLDAKKVKAFNIPKKPSSVEATEDKPVEPVVEKPADAPAVETPAEVAEATAEVESKVEEKPVEIPAVAPAVAEAIADKPAAEESKPIPEASTPEQPVA